MNGYNGNQDERRYGRGVLLGDYGTDEAGMAGTPGAGGASQGAAPEQTATGGAPLFFCECALSAQGKVTEKVETGPLGRDHFTYAYDAVGHLTEVRKNELLVEYYQFDEDGRRVQDFRAWAGQKRTLTYNFDGTLIQAGKDRLEWTDKGQLSVMELDGQRMSFTYGHDSRLDRVTLANGSDVRYFYGNELLPVKIAYNGATLAEYQWKDTLRLERCRVNGLHYAFVYGQGRAPVQVTVSGTAEAVHKATGLHDKQVTLQVFTDQVDSIRVLALPDGRPVKCIEYDSFGNVAVDTKPNWQFPLGFACGLNDHYTGFVRFGFRDYDPRFGRFTAKDPIGDTGGDHDLWEYCVDDPVGCLDPDGLLTRGDYGSRTALRARSMASTSPGLLSAEQQKYLEDVGRGLGLGTGAVVDGILHMGDMATAPLRAAMNYGNSLLDGNPNYFQPTRGNITDKLGLPKPRNEQERRIYAVNEAASSALTGAGLLGGTQAGAAALEHAGRAAGAATAYVPTAMNAARSAAGGAYYKAKPVVGKAVSAVRKLPSEPEKLGRVVKGVTDFAEGAMPGPPSNMSWPAISGYVAKWLYDNK